MEAWKKVIQEGIMAQIAFYFLNAQENEGLEDKEKG